MIWDGPGRRIYRVVLTYEGGWESEEVCLEEDSYEGAVVSSLRGPRPVFAKKSVMRPVAAAVWAESQPTRGCQRDVATAVETAHGRFVRRVRFEILDPDAPSIRRVTGA